jgi:prolyl-tRNA editing enzyme YbaK/EbsC (Cys-tRNA(Pro) deacylase)
MSADSVRSWVAEHAPDLPIIEVAESTATVDLAAQALGVEPGRIAKTLAIRVNGEVFLLVARGDSRLDNAKTKKAFGGRPRMLGPEETLALTGHPVGGVCPFGLANPLRIYCDVSLQAFDQVFPAAGSLNSSVKLPPTRLAELVSAEWVDVCKLPEPQAALG